MDHRDNQTWVTVELSRLGENKVEDGSLAESLRKKLGVEEDWPLFIPATTYIKDGKKVTIHLLEGYAFIGSGLAEIHYFSLEKTGIVNQVMSSKGANGIRVLNVIQDSHVHDMKQKLQEIVSEDIEIGTQVKVLEGSIYAALAGKVLGVDGDHVFVKLDLRSLSVITPIPRVFLQICEG